MEALYSGRLLKRAAFLHRTYEDAGVLHLLKVAFDAGLHLMQAGIQKMPASSYVRCSPREDAALHPCITLHRPLYIQNYEYQ